MDPVEEGSNPFVRGFKNPSFHLVALSLSLVFGRSPASMQLGKNPLACILNGLKERLENLLYSLSPSQVVCLLTHQQNYSFFCRGRLDGRVLSRGIIDLICQCPEGLVQKLEQDTYHFSLREISYSYPQPFPICDLVEMTISYGFSKMEQKNWVVLWVAAAGSDLRAQQEF